MIFHFRIIVSIMILHFRIIRLHEVKPKLQFQKVGSVIRKKCLDIQMKSNQVKAWTFTANHKKKSLRTTEIRLLKEVYGNPCLLQMRWSF